jgi:hypothetical protein
VTPGTLETAFSTRVLQAAQLMPVTLYCSILLSFLPVISIAFLPDCGHMHYASAPRPVRRSLHQFLQCRDQFIDHFVIALSDIPYHA